MLDKSLKLLLVVIVGLLTLNLIGKNNIEPWFPFLETKVEATSPAFVQIGRTYKCILLNRTESQNFEVRQIDKENGWIEARWEWTSAPTITSGAGGTSWFNLAHFTSCEEIKSTSNKPNK